jgi:hypothetical protein
MSDTNYYGEKVPTEAPRWGFLNVGRFTCITGLRFVDDVRILADPSAVGVGEVQVLNCFFSGRVEHTPNVRFEYCFFERGAPVEWKADIALGGPTLPAPEPPNE